MSTMEIKMPQNYDFSTRKTDWSKFKPYYLLRTDAVWEKSKLYQYFYSLYKAPLYFNNNRFYLISDVFMYYNILHKEEGAVSPDDIGESSENHHPAKLYNSLYPGALFSKDIVSNKNTPRKTSQFLGDWGKETTLLCTIKFFRYMRCKEKSPAKLAYSGGSNENFMDFNCHEELAEMNEHCIMYHFKVYYEMFYLRMKNDEFKVHSTEKINRSGTVERYPVQTRKLYY